jgi:hypothetical protein
MSDWPHTRCPYCGEIVDQSDKSIVYAVESAQARTMGGSQLIYGKGGWFHADCPPEAVGYARRLKSGTEHGTA